MPHIVVVYYTTTMADGYQTLTEALQQIEQENPEIARIAAQGAWDMWRLLRQQRRKYRRVIEAVLEQNPTADHWAQAERVIEALRSSGYLIVALPEGSA